MVIEVDDSGWGDLLGGAVIVMRRLGRNDKYVGEVPIDAFQGKSFKAKAYLSHVLRIVREGAVVLGFEKDEPIRVCTGYILSEVRKTLTNEGYIVVPSRIAGATQEFAEEAYLRHLSHLGVGTPEETRRIRGFNASLAWVLRDVDKRERFVKTGWKSWSKLRNGKDYDPKQT